MTDLSREVNLAATEAQEAVLRLASKFDKREDYTLLEDAAAVVQRFVVAAGCRAADAQQPVESLGNRPGHWKWDPDPARANRQLIENLMELWDLVPEQRFGQLVKNLTREKHGGFADPWEWNHAAWRVRIERFLAVLRLCHPGDNPNH